MTHLFLVDFTPRECIEAGLTRAGAKNLRVEPFDFNGHACSYRVRWDS
ncbi:DUF2378 family protein [Corallococcus exiguus]|nr:DUF2378 family protein [Corallococcus exiguus]